jgi:hypothetical protein
MIPMNKSKTSTLSTTLTKEAKEALSAFCLRRGLKINSFLEEIIWDRLEEEMDLEIANNTSHDELVDLEDLKKTLKKRA